VSRTLIANDHEGIAMAPGFDNGTVYVSTVPANVTTVYGAGAGSALSSTQRNLIIAYKLGATGKLPDTVGS
jgi:hypothetical protein